LGEQIRRDVNPGSQLGLCSKRGATGAAEGGNEMEIKRCGSQPSRTGPSDYFTGTLRIGPLFDAPEPRRVSRASVTFEPGARTAWHIRSARP
jgi:hypothetical protein